MSWRQRLFNFLCRIGRPLWDIDTPSDVRNVIEGEAALPLGRALDAGCGTGTMVIYLAQHGWEAIGVDFRCSSEASNDVDIAFPYVLQAGPQTWAFVRSATALLLKELFAVLEFILLDL